MEILESLAAVAGIGGIAVGVLAIAYRDILAQKIFPELTKRQAYKIIRLIIVLVWVVALSGLASWTYLSAQQKHGTSQTTEMLLPRGTLTHIGNFYQLHLAKTKMTLRSMGGNRNGFDATLNFVSESRPGIVSEGLGEVTMRKGEWHDLVVAGKGIIRIRATDVTFVDGRSDKTLFSFSVEKIAP